MAARSIAKLAPSKTDLRLDILKTVRDLMVAQTKVENTFVTTYRGARAEFVKAGIPPAVLDQPTLRTPYEFITDECFATLVRSEHGLQLELRWPDGKSPHWFGGGHPALDEISRMIRIDAGAWLNSCNFDEAKQAFVQTDRLLDDWRAEDYRQPRDRRYRFDAKELHLLRTLLDRLAWAVAVADVSIAAPTDLPKARAPRKPSPAKRAKLAQAAKADVQVQQLLKTAISKAAKRKPAL